MKILFLCSLILFLSGCGSKTDTITATSEPGNIKGKVKLYDTNGVILPDAGGMKVAMEGTTYSTLTTSDGTWELQNVPAGTYPSVIFSKPGFPSMKTLQDPVGAFIVGGGGTQYVETMKIYQISNITVNLVIRPFEDDTEIFSKDSVVNSVRTPVFDTVIIPSGRATFTCRILDNVANGSYLYCGVLYFGKTANIDPTDPASFLLQSCVNPDGALPAYVSVTDEASGIAGFVVNMTTLQLAGFHSGETVYCVGYFGNYYIVYNNYTDPGSGKLIFPGFSPNHSEVKSFVLP